MQILLIRNLFKYPITDRDHIRYRGDGVNIYHGSRGSYVFSFLLCFSMQYAEEELVKKTDFLLNEAEIMLPVPDDLKSAPFCRLKTLAIQKDAWSCGYHAIFNAVALEKTIGNYKNFHESFKQYLADKTLFDQVYSTAKEVIQKNKPLNGHEVIQICNRFSIANKSLSLFFNDHHEILIPKLYVEVTHPLTMSKQEIEKLLKEKMVSTTQSRIESLIRDNYKENAGSYFICNTGNHYVLFSILTDTRRRANLYMIGAWNEPVDDGMRKYIQLFLDKVAMLNRDL